MPRRATRRPTTLRFAPPPSPPPPVSAAELTRHLLCVLNSRPSPLPYLPAHAPAHHSYLSLLTLLPDVKPSDPALSSFLAAVASVPARIPTHTRAAVAVSAHKLQSAALLAAITAFHSAVSCLLALEETPEAASSEVTDSASGRLQSETASSHALQNKPRHNFAGMVASKVAEPLRWRLAARAVRKLAKADWLLHIPLAKRSQDQYLMERMGFVPEYLAHVKSPPSRVVFIYVIDACILGKGVAVSVAIRCLMMYIMARLAENSVLTAHAAFLATRFGLTGTQLAAAMDLPFLVGLQNVLKRKRRELGVVSGSTTTMSTMSSVSSGGITPKRQRFRVRRRQRVAKEDTFDELMPVDREERRLTRELSLGVGFGAQRRAFSLMTRRKRAVFAQSVVDTHESPETHQDNASITSHDLLPEPELKWQTLDDDTDSEDGTTDSSDGIQPHHNIQFEENDTSFYDLGDNPEVPDVDGLNAIHTGEDYGIFDDGADAGNSEPLQIYDHFQSPTAPDEIVPVEDDVEYDNETDLMNPENPIFSEEEVAVLLLAHDVADASRLNSRKTTNNPDATPKPLVRPSQAALIHELFDAEAIMDIIAVVAAFQLLQRWTVCYPYRPGTLEPPVFKFVQTPIAHDLCVGSVGQRSSSKSSAKLRMKRGRSIRLPRHALVDSI